MAEHYYSSEERNAQLQALAALCAQMADVIERAVADGAEGADECAGCVSLYRDAAATLRQWAENPKKVYRVSELEEIYPIDFYLYDTISERGQTVELTPPQDQVPAWYREVLSLRQEISVAFRQLTSIGEY